MKSWKSHREITSLSGIVRVIKHHAIIVNEIHQTKSKMLFKKNTFVNPMIPCYEN